jgi:hypothetical protein
MSALAFALALVAGALAILHLVWGLGSHWPAASAERLAKSAVGTPGITRMPGMAASLVVAALLAGVAIWPLFGAGLLPAVWPRWLEQLAGAGIVAVFLGRGVAGYTQAWRRLVPEEPFASYDRRYYSPLCLALGAGYLAILIAGRIT